MGNQRVITNISTGDVGIITGVNDASDLDWSSADSTVPQAAVIDLPSDLNRRAMAGGVYLDGTGFGVFRESVSLVDSVLTFTADIAWDGDGSGVLFSQGGDNGGWVFGVFAPGELKFIAKKSGLSATHFLESSNASLEASRSYHVAAVVDFTTASRAVTFYVDGEPFASTTLAAADGTYGESPTRNFGIGARDLGGTPSLFFEGTISNAAAFNTALTADQIADLAKYKLPGFLARNPQYRWGAATALTSGTLEVGQRYRINTFVAGDDFTNVGGTNVTGNEFTATGTTPTTWTNSSELVAVGARTALPMDEGIGYQLHDISGNHNDALLSETGTVWTQPKTSGYIIERDVDAYNGGSGNVELISSTRPILPPRWVATAITVFNQPGSSEVVSVSGQYSSRAAYAPAFTSSGAFYTANRLPIQPSGKIQNGFNNFRVSSTDPDATNLTFRIDYIDLGAD